MDTNHSPLHLTEALTRAHHHLATSARGAAAPPITIAFSREAGTYGAAIARGVADQLGWPAYDRELLNRIADDMGVRRQLLDSVDERSVSWLSECLEGYFAVPTVNQTAYFRRLLETLLALSAKGNCVIVGRAATALLPLATTLRVRVVAPLEHRIAAVAREHGLSYKEAAARVEKTDKERDHFVTTHCEIDPRAPVNYDLVLNVARFSPEECADLVLTALEQLQKHQSAELTPGLAAASAAP